MEQEQLKTITDSISCLENLSRIDTDILSEEDVYKIKNIFPRFRNTLTKKEYDSIQSIIRDSIKSDYMNIKNFLEVNLFDARVYSLASLKNNKLSEELLKENKQQEEFLNKRTELLNTKQSKLDSQELEIQKQIDGLIEKEHNIKQELVDEKNKNTRKQDELENKIKSLQEELKLQKEYHDLEIDTMQDVIKNQNETIKYYRELHKDPIIVQPQIVSPTVIQSDLHNNIVK